MVRTLSVFVLALANLNQLNPTRWTSVVNNVSSSIIQKSELGRVKGVVTYYFNDNFGDKGDVGARVFLLSGTVELPNDRCELHITKDQLSIVYALTVADGKENNAAAKRNLPIPHPIPPPLIVPVLDATMVDVNGAFEFDEVSPGAYTVVIQSSHSKGDYYKTRDQDGRLAFVAAEVRPGRTIDASYKFPASGRRN